MKNKKKNSTVVVFSILISIVAVVVGVLYYITSTINNYSFSEKKWINENKDVAIEVYVEKNLPIFSDGGNGVYYDYLNALKTDTGLTFDVSTTTTSESGISLSNKNTITESDIVVFKDHFVLIGKNDNFVSLNDLSNKKIGILTSDKELITYYLTDITGVSLVNTDTFDGLKDDYNNSVVEYMIIPLYKYLDEIISEKYSIAYHLDGLYSYYTLSFESEFADLNSIMTKFYNRWKNKGESKAKEYFVSLYYELENFTEIEKESITNDDFIVGYIDNLPYEGMISGDFTGLTNVYLGKFSDITGVTYKFIKYKDTKELSGALNDKKIDLALNYYSLSNNNYEDSVMLGSSEYVVLAHVDNNIVVNSLYSLVNVEVSMLSNMNLKYNMSSKNKFEIKSYDTVEEMAKTLNEKSIVIIEKEAYDYYMDSIFKKFTMRYNGVEKLNNSFLLNKDNAAYNRLFNFFLTTQSNREVKNESVYGIFETLKNNKIVYFIISNFVYIVIAFVIVICIGYVVTKKIINDKKNKKEDRLYYFDVMTNLKNRNYLNDNIDFWSSTKVYPQAIIVIDINGLKTLNDKSGHEAGDNQIKAVASVLIKTQRDNSEIMRTDGDEFIIYLVGYDEKKIGSYIHKLTRELSSSLPNKQYGVSIGYSMILNEQTTIDDAINDSLLMIKKSKDK